jgi:hypothetical protein
VAQLRIRLQQARQFARLEDVEDFQNRARFIAAMVDLYSNQYVRKRSKALQKKTNKQTNKQNKQESMK